MKTSAITKKKNSNPIVPEEKRITEKRVTMFRIQMFAAELEGLWSKSATSADKEVVLGGRNRCIECWQSIETST